MAVLRILIMISSKFEAVFIVIALVGTVAAVVCPTGTNVIPQCTACTGSGSSITCITCLSGYYLVGGSCVACSSVLTNCAQCTLGTGSVPQCFICQSGYGLLNATCANCSSISGCSSCIVWNYQLQCSACNTGLVLYSAQMQCVPCQISNCNNCSISSSGNFSCASCATGYFNTNNTCSSCAQSIAYCASCQRDTNSKLICTSCAATRLYLSNNTCLADCAANGYPRCATCQLLSLTTNNIACLTCNPNYYLNPSSQSCQSCSQALTGCANCSAASSSSSNSTQATITCSACTDGYFLSSSPATCVLCSSVRPNCQSCSFDFGAQTGQCTLCASGYYLNSTDLTCYSCTSPPSGTPTFPAGSCSSCAMNGSSMICTICSSTYYLVNTTCLTCSSYMANCSTCTFNSSFCCTGCKSGWLLSSAGQCPLCSSIYSNCKFCSASECTDCISGYYTLDNKQCLQNCLVSNCKQCVTKDNSKCLTCGAGYVLSGSACVMQTCTSPLSFNGVACVCPFQSYYQSTGNTCQPCSDSFCEICQSNQCSSCLDGYFLQNNASCVKCISNCESCITSNTCLLCTEGFYFNQTSCVAYSQTVLGVIGVLQNNNLYQLCGLGCAICTSSTCLSCAPGYFLNGSSCSFCPSDCKICTTTSAIVTTTTNSTNSTNATSVNTTVITVVCLECNSGMALINLTCSACIDSNCVRCDYNAQFCLLCTMTYTADSYGTCKACAANCNFCESGGPGTCDDGSCFLGYILANSTSCVRCLQGCASCSLSALTCIGCLVGSYSLPNSSCANCPAGCLTCTNYTSCTSCDPNFSLQNGACLVACELPCVACSSINGTQICTNCLRGYSLISGSCQDDFSCETSSICEFCPLGLFAYKGQCHQCASNCMACTFSPTDPVFVVSGSNYLTYLNCTKCNTGFYIDTSLNCQPCRSSCRHCLALNLCSQCVAGYFLEYKLLNGISNLNYSVGVCKKCGSGCSECQAEPNRCLSCKSSFFLSNFVCSSLKNISFVFTLAPVSNSSSKGMLAAVLSNLPQLYSDISNSLGSTYAQNNYLVILSSIINGSVVVSGSAGIDPSLFDPSAAYNSVSDNLKQASKISGYSVFAYSLSANGFTPSTTTTTSSNNYILYIIIGGAILAVGIIVLVICLCLRHRRKKQLEDNPAMQTEKVETEQNEPATSKNMLKSQEVFPKSSVGQVKPKKSKTQKEIPVSDVSGSKTIEPSGDKPSHSPSNRDKSKKQNRQKEIQYSRNERDNDREISVHSKQSKSKHDRKNEVSRLPQIVSRIDQQLKESEEISKNVMKSKSKSKSSKNLPESMQHQETMHFKSVRNIQEDYSRPKPRDIEKLCNDTNIEEPQPPKQSRRSQKGNSNSISQKNVPNSNSHYI